MEKTKKKRKRPTEKQLQAAEYLKAGYPVKNAAKEAGYRDANQLTKSEFFQDIILGNIDEDAIVHNLQSIALQQENMSAAINSAKELLKLKNRYPESKMTVHKYEATLADILEHKAGEEEEVEEEDTDE